MDCLIAFMLQLILMFQKLFIGTIQKNRGSQKKTEFRYLAKNTRKPAPEILEIIIRDFKASKENAIYI